MARKGSAQLESEKFSPALEESPVLRQARPRAVPQRRRPVLKWALSGALCLTAALLLLKAANYLDHLLATHPRFRLPSEPPEPGDPRFQIRGLRYTPRHEVLGVFAPDFGRSVYLTPLEERRRRLTAIDWVREALVARRWPNHLLVHIVERTPVAFVLPTEADGEEPRRPALIDREGVLLRPPPRAEFSLPVLLGITSGQSLAERRRRVSVALKLLEEAGPYEGEITEVDLTDPENAVARLSLEGRIVELWLGAENFGRRLRAFREHYAGIRRQRPDARIFDLRVDGQIAAPGAEAAGADPAQRRTAMVREKKAHAR